jgi:hypothetical protein
MVFAPFSRNSSFWRPADACSFASNLLLSGYQRATDNNGHSSALPQIDLHCRRRAVRSL